LQFSVFLVKRQLFCVTIVMLRLFCVLRLCSASLLSCETQLSYCKLLHQLWQLFKKGGTGSCWLYCMVNT